MLREHEQDPHSTVLCEECPFAPTAASETQERQLNASPATHLDTQKSCASLLVFSDDWGRHPSSCQHLIARLLPQIPVCWVNTIGMRTPKFDWTTLTRGAEKLRHWLSRPSETIELPDNLRVISPKMWPWLTRSYDRKLNQLLLTRQLERQLQTMPQPVIAVTTLPITADLVGQIPVEKWVYYCVDDFSVWPGLDGHTMKEMDREMIQAADTLVAVSETLQDHIARHGREASLLTHGVDLDHWTAEASHSSTSPFAGLETPIMLFWGVIDRRMDVDYVNRLASSLDKGSIVLTGPESDPESALYASDKVVRFPAVPFHKLPTLAAAADVLIMPYGDLPVTQAMQPLKLKEYLATGKPVVVRDLPATRAWSDCLDIASSPDQFAQHVLDRAKCGLPESQRQARRRLDEESWTAKTKEFERVLVADSCKPNRRPVVLHTRVVTSTGGGPEKTILNSPRHLDRLGYDSLCAFLHPPNDPGFEELKRRATAAGAGGAILSVPDRGALDLSVVRQLLRICREHNVAVWHGHDYKSNALGLLLRRFWPMKLVTTVHGWVLTSKRMAVYNAVDRMCLRHYDKVICVSEELLDECLRAGVRSRDCLLVDNAIDVDVYTRQQTPEEAKRDFGLSPSTPVIGTVGRLSPEKGFDVLIQAVDKVLDAGIDVALLIAGDGPCRESLQQQIVQLGREANIKLLGFQSDPHRLYEAMDVFVSSSFSEGLPNVVLEAMALRVPVVATEIAGNKRLIEDGKNGLFVRPGNANDLATTIMRLLHNSALRSQLADTARQTIETDYSFSRRMEKIQTVYDDLLQSGPTTSADVLPRESRGRSETACEESPRKSRQVRGRLRIEPARDPQQWKQYLDTKSAAGFHQNPGWLHVLEQGLGHEAHFLQAVRGNDIVGVLPLALVASRLFGRFLVSLPYLNSAGVVADDEETARALVDRAVRLADALDVRFLELRHEQAVEHPMLNHQMTHKVHMRLPLPGSSDELWTNLKSKVRSQVRKAMKNEQLTVHWGHTELLDEFYNVFCHNMRDLGTPPFSRKLFHSILTVFPDASELCCVRLSGRPIAAALLIHGPGVTEVPSASSLRQFNSTNANMLMYWHLLERTVQRGQSVFDFGRSTVDGGTYRFKKQWDAVPHPAVWQYYVRHGEAADMRPDNGRFDLMIRLWQHLPVAVTRWIGPPIVRGIP